MKKILIISLVVISTIMLSGCGIGNNSSDNGEKINTQFKKKEEVTKKIDTCPNCVYALYTSAEYINYRDNYYGILPDYHKDYTELKYIDTGEQIPYFLGHELDNNGKVVKSYACGIDDNKVFCLEGSKDENAYEKNKKILKEIFGEENCEEKDMDYGIGLFYKCMHKSNSIRYSIVYKSGRVSTYQVSYSSSGCTVSDDLKPSCS